MQHDPGPYFIQLKYVSGANPHIMQYSVGDWTPPFGLFLTGTVTGKDGNQYDLGGAVDAYVDKLKAFWTNGTTFINWLLFKKLLPTDIPVPVMGGNVTTGTGTATAGFAEEATQQTINYRTLDFNLMKIVLLDYNEDVSFSKILVVPGSGPLFDLDAYLHSAGCTVRGRDGAFAGSFVSATKKLNDKLRKEYRQA